MPVLASRLVNDLSKIPNIVGGLGLSIAAAQKAFNLDYLESIERLVALAGSMLGEKGQNNEDLSAKTADLRAFLMELIRALAPPRYQFTETTLAVRMDLSQTMSANVGVGLGVGYGGVAVNASLALGYRYDYRAAAECRTVINAIPPDPAMLQTLLERAKELANKALELPPRSEVDQGIIAQAQRIFEKVVGAAPRAITNEASTP